MHHDRFFDPDPTVLRLARTIYEETTSLPIISPHGHVDARLLADDSPFPEPTALIVLPDHYILRMLYSVGVPLERLGIPPLKSSTISDSGSEASVGSPPVETNPRRIWQILGEHYHLFRGTPTAAWLDYQLWFVFEVRKPLNATTAPAIYDEILEKLRSPEFRP